MLMLRVKELDTAAMLTEQLPRVEVFTLMSVSSVDDSSDPGSGIDFKSRNEDRISVSEVPILTVANMVTLPKGQAFALLEGGQHWKIRIRLPDNREDAAMPSDFEEMADAMLRSYITNDHWYRVTDQSPKHGGTDGTPPTRHTPGTFSRVLTGLAQCLKWLFFPLIFSVLIEWIGMVFWWEEQGLDHCRQMLENELQFLGAYFHCSWLTAHPMQFAIDLSGRFYRPVADYILAGMQITQVFAVRLAILTLATPIFGLFTLVALVDGLVRRDLRRWGGGRESSFVYHYDKKAAIPLIIMACVLYLALPFSLYPSWIILPFALAFAFAVTITASTFKKYL